MNRHNGAWTVAREEQLREMWHPTGPSCSEIAREINRDGGQHLTKCAIIGKARRLGLAGRAPVPPPKRRSPRVTRPPVSRVVTDGPAITQPCPPMRPIDNPPVSLPSCAIPLLDLATHGCRWPDGEGTLEDPYLFCGAISVEGSSYCRFHREMAVGETHRFSAEQRSALACRLRAQRTNQSNAAKLNMVGEMPTIEEL